MPGERLSPASGPADLCGVYIQTDDDSGLAKKITPIRIGARLSQSFPKD